MKKELIYLNTLKKETEKNKKSTTQVNLFALDSSWQLNWKVISEDGEVIKDLNIEKKDFEAIVLQLRLEFKQCIGQGYLPLFFDHFNQSKALSPKNKRTQSLFYYSEQMTNPDLFEMLRRWRREESEKLNKPPYIISSNRVLKMLSTFIPKTKEELLQIPGYATTKVEQYGEEIINLTKQFERTTTFPLDWVEEQIDVQHFDEWLYKNQLMK
ncbi:HRDC domain-containing protein [Chengkuizengella sediminis]|uniref:HRDC domain-containing protein n=1 Tax=Chengkuizengella sediminis TaxID=1885917 RepID=UPI00138A694D|nr:HRDC domain-containing protein [Chengkuizengella sediminis]NDI35834.1 hypothetical protein [Chengkuizengella sediminis]